VEEFWALRDLDFEIARGEVVGIIGRNGAGKSTLLKILSRITEPSEGQVEIRGRVASLLEVGTGFHPELTGRENIYLNGAILGMRRAEIRRKFDEIVAFAEVEQFLDTPVKRYSSGMYVRLAFAVAAHLEPEILVVDEVLAVGDAEFQKKCLGKMQDVASHGRTVLFVSHQLGMVSRLCSRGIVLDRGRLTFAGFANEAIDTYVAQSARTGSMVFDETKDQSSPAALLDFATVGPDGAHTSEFLWHDPIKVRIGVDVRRPSTAMTLGVAIESRHAVRVTTWNVRVLDHVSEPGRTQFELVIPGELLAPGSYSFTVALFEPGTQIHQMVEREWPIHIVDSGSSMAEFSRDDYGVVLIPAEWSTSRPQAAVRSTAQPTLSAP
jgi:lipopolysaccharide transport system ATP-binding protein